MVSLVVVGNGFDLAHGMPSSYFAFRDHLMNKNEDLHEILTKLGGENIWEDFESNLAHMDIQELTKELIDSTGLPEKTLSEFRSQTKSSFAGHSIRSTLERVGSKISDELHGELKEWILSIDTLHIGHTEQIAKFHPDDYFVSFNYTSTIERIYNIDPNRILYIHNKAAEDWVSFGFKFIQNDELLDYIRHGSRLIFGHGFQGLHPDFSFNLPTDWDGGQNPDEGLIREAYEHACSIYSSTYKNTENSIISLKTLLDEIGRLDQVVIIGHSMSNVDIDYFNVIATRADNDTTYKITHFGLQNKKTSRGKGLEFY